MTQGIDAGAIASNISNPEAAPAPAPAPEEQQQSTEGGEVVEAEQPVQPQVEEEKPEQDPDFVRRFNALARKEREIREREQQFKSKYGEYESYQKEREKLKENPMDFLESNGWTFKELADYVLNNNNPTPDQQVSKLQQRIDQLEAERKQEIEDRKKNEELEKNKQTISEFKSNLKKEISAENEQFELINHFGEYDTVYDVIDNYYNAHGVILDVKKAAMEVEKYLESQFEKAASTNKVKKKFSQFFEPQKETEAESKPSSQASNEPSTLTNDVVSSGASSPASEQPYLSDEESKARAAEILREHLLRKKGYTKT